MSAKGNSLPNGKSIAIAGLMIAFGVHQITNSKKWNSYVPPVIATVVPLRKETIVKLHGTGNVSLGLLYLLFSNNRIIHHTATTWWGTVMLLCGRHSWREGLRDAPVFLYLLAKGMRKNI